MLVVFETRIRDCVQTHVYLGGNWKITVLTPIQPAAVKDEAIEKMFNQHCHEMI